MLGAETMAPRIPDIRQTEEVLPMSEQRVSARTEKENRDDVAEWVLCPQCRTALYGKRFTRDLRVCSDCGRHQPLTAQERLRQLADDGWFAELALSAPDAGPLDTGPLDAGSLDAGSLDTGPLDTGPLDSVDPLNFVDTVPYPTRLAAARARTGMAEAVLCARATIEGSPAIFAVMDFRFMGGSLGSAVGELITLAAETALGERTPLVIVTSSGGARMQEGALALMQMAKTSSALGELDKAGILTISLITDPTFGGVAASFATLTDVIIAEPGARLGFAGRRVIEQTIRQSLPADFQTAEFLLERGFIDMITPRPRLRHELAKLLRVGAHTRPALHSAQTETGRPEIGQPEIARPEIAQSEIGSLSATLVRDPGLLPEPDPWRQVSKARALTRPTSLDYFALAFEDFQELHGDRISGECSAIVGGTAWLQGSPVVVIGQQKGHAPTELMKRNFGMATPAGYRKAARLMSLADKLDLPVITLVDTPGAYPGADAEEQGQAVVIAENLRLMASLRVPVVTVIIGEGGSGGALALAVANRVLMFSDSVYSVISPEGCAAIIWKDPAAAPRAAAALRLNSRDLLELGVVDAVLPEPEGGTGAAPLSAADRLRTAIGESLRELSQLSREELSCDRRARFRRFGNTGQDVRRGPITAPVTLPLAETA
jgi:acetyl-CoA carboxylase carboxyl transferase alpha subunit/acetyl-CoA carboxylase carboxyl transferase beta subunit